jgi:hypothetical protein
MSPGATEPPTPVAVLRSDDTGLEMAATRAPRRAAWTAWFQRQK